MSWEPNMEDWEGFCWMNESTSWWVGGQVNKQADGKIDGFLLIQYSSWPISLLIRYRNIKKHSWLVVLLFSGRKMMERSMICRLSKNPNDKVEIMNPNLDWRPSERNLQMLKFCHHMRNGLPLTLPLSLGFSRDIHYLLKKLIDADNCMTACEKNNMCILLLYSADTPSTNRHTCVAKIKNLHLALNWIAKSINSLLVSTKSRMSWKFFLRYAMLYLWWNNQTRIFQS